MAERPTGTVTFLFTDIEGSTRLWEDQPNAMRLVLARHDALLRDAIESNDGTVFKTIGDAFCAVFERACDAVNAAATAQLALRGLPTLDVRSIDERTLRVRMALHCGDADERDGDYFGPVLNRVSRLLSVARGGQILLSHAVRDASADALPPDITIKHLGALRLRDLRREPVFQLLHPDLPAEFNLLFTQDPLSNNLPRPLTSFVGREEEMDEVHRLLDRSRLLTLTGAGGCGKTRLALQIADELFYDYPDGVWLVSLEALFDPALVPQTIATTLALREEAGTPVQDALVTHLKSMSLLLLLDNCEHLLPACGDLAYVLLRACPQLRILATSRAALSVPGEVTYRIPSLPTPDPNRLPPVAEMETYAAVQLFVDRAAYGVPDYALTSQNAPAIAQVCHRLDGIPLAIELAAARVRSLPVDEIAGRLGNMFHLLTGGSRTLLKRQQTLRALVDWSYDLLNDAEKTMLHRLAVFAGGWTLEAAEAICADQGDFEAPADPSAAAGQALQGAHGSHDAGARSAFSPARLHRFDILDLLASLVDKSLVIYDEVRERYRMLEVIRQYAQEKLVQGVEDASVRSRHCDTYLALVEEAEINMYGPDQGRWFDRAEAEHDNLRSALQWSHGAPNAGETELRLVGALGRLWDTRGYLREARKRLTDALERPGNDGPTAFRAKALVKLGWICYLHNDMPSARTLYSESLTIYRQLTMLPETGMALHLLAIVARREGDLDEAKRRFEEVLSIQKETGDAISSTLFNLGRIADAQGDHATAYRLKKESVDLHRLEGSLQHVATGLTGLGMSACKLERIAEARAHLVESLTILRQIGAKVDMLNTLEAFGLVEAAQGRPESAARLWGTVEALREEIGPLSTLPEVDRSQVIATLGDSQFAVVYEQGRGTTLEDVVRATLDSHEQPQTV